MSKRAPLIAAGLAAVVALVAWWLLASPRASRGAASTTGPAAEAPSSNDPGKTPGSGTATGGGGGGKVALAPAVTQGLIDFARKPWTQVPLRTDGHARTRSIMRGIAGGAIDLEHAKARKSIRFQRTSYTTDATSDVPIHLGDRWGPDGKALGAAAAKPLAEPTRVVYREGDDGTTFSLAKMKEAASPGTGLESAVATQKAESFFVDNGLLAEAGGDHIEPYEVRERRVATEAPGGGDQDLLAQQDILLRRTYDGKQVINSHASVGVLPDSGEVVQVKVERWTPVNPDGTTTVKPELPEEQARSTAGQLEGKLRRQIELDTGTTLLSAQVEHVEEAWFQTDAGLIPVLVFVVKVIFAEDPKEARNLVVAINPNGDDALIWDQGRIVRGAPAEPSEP